jgi:hypothetical protein
MASLLKQLLQCLGPKPWPKVLLQKLLLQSATPRSLLDINALSDLIRLCIEQFNKTFFIFDAIDELESRADRACLFDFLDAARTWNGDVKILLTSPPHISLNQLQKSAQILSMAVSDADLKIYIRYQIKYRQFGLDLENEIIAQILSAADGMYYLMLLLIIEGSCLSRTTLLQSCARSLRLE